MTSALFRQSDVRCEEYFYQTRCVYRVMDGEEEVRLVMTMVWNVNVIGVDEQLYMCKV